MFDLADRPLVWIPVKWTVLRPGEGDHKDAIETEVSIKIEVELKDRDDVAEISVKLFGLDVEDDDKPQPSIADQLKDAKKGRDKEVALFLEIVRDWQGVKKDGVEQPFSAENVRLMLGIPGFWGAFQSAYMSACVGKLETRKGN